MNSANSPSSSAPEAPQKTPWEINQEHPNCHVYPPRLGVWETTKSFMIKINNILGTRQEYLDKTSLDYIKPKMEKLRIRAYGTEKITLPLTTKDTKEGELKAKEKNEEAETFSDFISIVVWNKNGEIEYLNLGYIKATGLFRLANNHWAQVFGAEGAEALNEINAKYRDRTSNLVEKIKYMAKNKFSHPKFGMIPILYKYIYDEKQLTDIMEKAPILAKEGKGYSDQVWRMKITETDLMWSSKNNELSGGNVRTGVDITKMKGVKSLLENSNKDTEESESAYRFKEGVSNFKFKDGLADYYGLFKVTVENAIYSMLELLIHKTDNPKNHLKDNNSEIKKTLVDIIEKARINFSDELKAEIIGKIKDYAPYDGEDDENMDFFRYQNVEEIRKNLIKTVMKSIGVTDEMKKEIAKKLKLGENTGGRLTKEEEDRINGEILNDDQYFTKFQNFLLKEIFTLSEKVKEVEKDLPEVEKMANIGDIIVDFGPLLIFSSHDDDIFFNNRCFSTMGLKKSQVDEMYHDGTMSEKVYGGNSFDLLKSEFKKKEAKGAITKNMVITRPNGEKIGVLWNAYKCNEGGSSIWIGTITDLIK